ncbi:hypothetical protein BLOT_010072 [Blomia tropicalis]|nr:hypothetical protein BLOT_010072 [Blomia tropicalis]
MGKDGQIYSNFGTLKSDDDGAGGGGGGCGCGTPIPPPPTTLDPGPGVVETLGIRSCADETFPFNNELVFVPFELNNDNIPNGFEFDPFIFVRIPFVPDIIDAGLCPPDICNSNRLQFDEPIIGLFNV